MRPATLGRGLITVNRNHPDALGLCFSWPLNEGGGGTAGYRAVVGSHRPVFSSKTAGVDSDWLTARPGIGVRMIEPSWRTLFDTFNPSKGTDLSVSCWVTLDANLANYGVFGQTIIFVGSVGFGIMPAGAQFGIGATADISTGTGQGAAPTGGQSYQVGFSLHSAASGFFYINGVETALTTFPTIGSNQLMLGHAGAGSAITVVSDIRVWNRFMPRATFERHYSQPSLFYKQGRVGSIRGRLVANSGGFMPFLHPAF